MLSEILQTLRALDGLSSPAGGFAVFFELPSFDERIVNAFAYRSAPSRPELAMEDWLAGHPWVWTKSVIPREMKGEVCDNLDQSNIIERVLFPGLDGLSQWLKQHYTPRDSDGGTVWHGPGGRLPSARLLAVVCNRTLRCTSIEGTVLTPRSEPNA